MQRNWSLMKVWEKDRGEQDKSTNHKDASYFTLGGIGSDASTHCNWTTWHGV